EPRERLPGYVDPDLVEHYAGEVFPGRRVEKTDARCAWITQGALVREPGRRLQIVDLRASCCSVDREAHINRLYDDIIGDRYRSRSPGRCEASDRRRQERPQLPLIAR